jgi:hypothetical protein
MLVDLVSVNTPRFVYMLFLLVLIQTPMFVEARSQNVLREQSHVVPVLTVSDELSLTVMQLLFFVISF